MKVCRLASRENFVGKCGNLKFNMHIYRKPVKVSKTLRDGDMGSLREQFDRESVLCAQSSQLHDCRIA